MTAKRLEFFALEDLPMVQRGDDVAALIIAAVERAEARLDTHDVVIIAQKIVSKAEGRLFILDDVEVSAEAAKLAQETEKDPRVVELILRESKRIVRSRPGLIIAEHRLGFIMANAGIDMSNTGGPSGKECALLLPLDSDLSASAIKSKLDQHFGAEVGVVINDSFGRPWRHGTMGVAIGAAGLPSIIDLRGEPDLDGRELLVSISGFADEIAAGASLLMGQGNEGRPVVIAKGLHWQAPETPVADMIRPAEGDLFR
ncbi:MAG: coenzyme F420-0:L-glutamate ligase [Pseudomonadota bacterium]